MSGDDDSKPKKVVMKAIDPNSPTQKWEITDSGLLQNKGNGFVAVLLEYTTSQGNYYVDAFVPEKLSELPFWPLKLYEYTWQLNSI